MVLTNHSSMEGRKQQSNDVSPLSLDFRPSNYTVICARGNAALKHPGNRRYQQIVNRYVGPYSDAKSRSEKSHVISCILEETKRDSHKSGGFVRLIDGRWYTVSDEYAREKIGQNLRNILFEKYKSSEKAKQPLRRERRTQRSGILPQSFQGRVEASKGKAATTTRTGPWPSSSQEGLSVLHRDTSSFILDGSERSESNCSSSYEQEHDIFGNDLPVQLSIPDSGTSGGLETPEAQQEIPEFTSFGDLKPPKCIDHDMTLSLPNPFVTFANPSSMLSETYGFGFGPYETSVMPLCDFKLGSTMPFTATKEQLQQEKQGHFHLDLEIGSNLPTQFLDESVLSPHLTSSEVNFAGERGRKQYQQSWNVLDDLFDSDDLQEVLGDYDTLTNM